MMYFTEYASPVGVLSVACSDKAVLGVWIAGQKYFLSKYDASLFLHRENEITKLCFSWFDDYFAGKRPEISAVPLDAHGSDFQKRVWELLIKIPYGETTTYGTIAKSISPKMSAQAVGGAVGHNPISIIIPCHRVVGSDGSLTGYAGSVEIKQKLLAFEKRCN